MSVINFQMQIIQAEGDKEDVVTIKGSRFSYEFRPKWGGILNQWEVLTDCNWRAVINAFDSAEDFKSNYGNKGFPSCKLSPYACRIRDSRYLFEGKSYRIGKFGYDRHNIHGLLFDSEFSIDNIIESDDKVNIVLVTTYRGEDSGFPFLYDLELDYQVDDSGFIYIKTTVKNVGNSGMPVVDGWHPYFSVSSRIDDVSLYILADEVLQFDENLIPTGEKLVFSDFNSPGLIGGMQMDNCFPLNGRTGMVCSLSYEELKLEISAWKHYNYLQLFIPPDRKSIAIELLSGAPDAFNNGMGLTVLQPGESRIFECSYHLKLSQ